MLSAEEKMALGIIREKQVITRKELLEKLKESKADGLVNISKLKDLGYIDAMDSLGPCYIITQKGIRAARGED